MALNVEKIAFDYASPRRMRIYALGIAADNLGKVLLTETPGVATMNHRPHADRSAIWDFGFDGHAIYQRTGGLADLVVFHLLIIRHKEDTRQAGKVIRTIGSDDGAASVIAGVKDLVGTTSPGGLVASVVLEALLPLADLVGGILEETKDRVLQTMSGSMFFDEQRKQHSAFSDQIRSTDANMFVDLKFSLFDAASDDDTTAAVTSTTSDLQANGLLLDL